MKKITGILLITFLSLHGTAQDMNPPQEDGILHRWLPEEWLTYFAVLLSIIAIALHFFRSRGSSKNKRSADDSIMISARQLDELRRALSNKLERRDINELIERINRIEAEPNSKEQPVLKTEWTDFERKTTEQESFSEAQTPEPVHELFFAKLADLDDGFSSGIIASVQNGEQVYEIQTMGDTATYRISGDLNAQKYALAESTFTLGKACELLNQPFKGCRIVLQKEGTLVKLGGNWIIQQKAKIEFK